VNLFPPPVDLLGIELPSGLKPDAADVDPGRGDSGLGALFHSFANGVGAHTQVRGRFVRPKPLSRRHSSTSRWP
jgi:hypothetical protein